MAKKSTRRGPDERHRDKDGEIRRKVGNTRVSTLRETYGKDFAPGIRGDAKLKDVLKGYGSLRGEFGVRRGIDISKPIFEQTKRGTRKGARH